MTICPSFVPNVEVQRRMAGKEITNDPALHALGRSMRATFSRDDLWPHISAMERVEYLGYALIQRDWLRQYGFVLAVTGPAICETGPLLKGRL
jgi:hypothetical protein